MFTWIDGYSVGIDEIDRQHKQLIELMNLLFNVDSLHHDNAKLTLLVDELYRFSAYHFTSEECYMLKYNYADMQNHVKEHDKLKEKITLFKEKTQLHESGLAMDILLFMKQWISVHLNSTDQKFYEFLKNAGVKL